MKESVPAGGFLDGPFRKSQQTDSKRNHFGGEIPRLYIREPKVDGWQVDSRARASSYSADRGDVEALRHPGAGGADDGLNTERKRSRLAVSIGVDRPGNPVSLQLNGALCIDQARILKESLLEALARHEIVEIDLSDVSGVDVASLQVLALIHREAQDARKILRITGGNAGWMRLVLTLGMQRYFGESLVMFSSSDPLELEHEPGSASANIL